MLDSIFSPKGTIRNGLGLSKEIAQPDGSVALFHRLSTETAWYLSCWGLRQSRGLAEDANGDHAERRADRDRPTGTETLNRWRRRHERDCRCLPHRAHEPAGRLSRAGAPPGARPGGDVSVRQVLATASGENARAGNRTDTTGRARRLLQRTAGPEAPRIGQQQPAEPGGQSQGGRGCGRVRVALQPSK